MPPRDLQKEYQWEKTVYRRFTLKVHKELGDELVAKLKADNISFSEWVRKHMINYVNEEE